MAGIVHDEVAADLSSRVINYTFPLEEEPSSFFTDAMETIPGITTSAAIKMGRGTNTITRGGWANTSIGSSSVSTAGLGKDRELRPGKRMTGARIHGLKNYWLGDGQIRGDGFFGGIGNIARNLRQSRGLGRSAPKETILGGGLAHLYHKPRNWTRVAHQDYFHMPYQDGKYKYNPFYASSIPNFFSRALTGHGPEGSRRQKWFGDHKAGHWLKTKRLADEATGDMFSRGWTSRVNASTRIMRGSDRAFGRSAASSWFAMQAARANGNEIFSNKKGMQEIRLGPSAQNRVQTSQTILGTMRGVSGIAGGYLARLDAAAGRGLTYSYMHEGARVSIILGKTGVNVRGQVGDVFTRSAQRGWVSGQRDLEAIRLNNATKKITARKAWKSGRETARTAGKGARASTLMRGARVAGAIGLRAGMAKVPFIGWAWLAADVARFGVRTAGRIANAAAEAGKSYNAGLSNPIMGAQFRDSDVSRTSRSRGVMEIQNSRLNARSILGTESGAMAAHFG